MGDLSHVQTIERISKVVGTDIADTVGTQQPLDLPFNNYRQFTITGVAGVFTPDLQPANGCGQSLQGTAAAFTIANPINVPAGDLFGGELQLVIINTTGGALGAITMGTQYKTAGAIVAPATGFRRVYTFCNMGTQAAPLWYETGRSAADVPN